MSGVSMGAGQRRMARARDVFATTALAAMIGHAYAQTPAAPAAAASAPQARANTLDTVTVTGYRSSLANSAREKREDVGLSETVFAEDIGKFPDASIADSLSRVPGVRVNRATIDGEGMNISIRGMGANFTRVLLNGAPMASASAGSWGGNISANREVDMDFLPSELFRSATVYKSQRASILEGGIAGTVDMRSVRPFDKQGFRSAFTLSGNYRETVGKLSDTGSALVSNTWRSSTFGEFGALVGAAWGHTKYRTTGFQTVDMRNFQLKSFQALASDNPNNTGGGSQSTPDTVPSGLALADLPAFARPILVPGAQINRDMLLALNPGANIKQIDNALMGRLGRHLNYEGERERASGVVSLQWRPNEKWDLYLDMMAAEKSNKMTYNAMNAGTRANTPIPIGMEFDRSDCTSGCVLTKATFANTFWSLEFRPMEEKTKFWSFNPGFELRPNDDWTIDAHFNMTYSDFYRDMPTVLLATRSPNSVITYDNSRTGELPIYGSNLNINDPANFGWYQAGQGLSGLRMDLYDRRNTTDGGRLNVKWGDEKFNVKAGVARDDIERRYRSYGVADAWMNVACGGNMNYRFFQPNTQLQSPGCDGRTTTGAVPATAYPGFGTGSTAGAPALAYLGSVVPNARVPEYAMASNQGFITVNWDKFAKDTDYQYFRDNIRKGFNNGSGGYIREVVDAAYAEVSGVLRPFNRTLRYNAGLRFTDTLQTIGEVTAQADPRNATLTNGGLYDNTGVWAYESIKYTNLLPSFTLAYNLMPDLIARASASKSMTRANPADLRQTRVSIGDQGARQGNLTNPSLKPFKANNFDLALEYYMSREAYVAVSGFGKDLTGRPASRLRTYTLAQLDAIYGTIGLTDAQQQAVNASGGRANHLVEITEPINIADKLKVRGVELTWQQPLDMLPVKGFGFTANYTYTKQTDSLPNALPVAGVPPRTNNLTVYYERNGLSFRVSRQYASEHIVNASVGLSSPGTYMWTTARTQIDASAGINLKQAFGFQYDTSINLSVWNATDAISRTYVQFPGAVFDEYKPGPSYTVSLRAAF
ncbi:TonB-dependent receptor [Pelomonas aquatica]|uniref:TonB-dependent receptor n=1 Tax=Pelomonas aquatica TaxID=431058 RepID=A0ABU1ZAJ6_9BURK|nr:TonB-dependent receptor [Pelomonas aquatica]MDR7297458.1 TonB-dependent receptor [Pelomonas aquatica]